MINRELDLYVKDSVFAPNQTDPVVTVRERQGRRPLYQVWLSLDGLDLPYVEQVRYKLHHTFKQDEVIITRSLSRPQFEVSIWTWGIFTVRAYIRDKRGTTHVLSHRLTYNEQDLKRDDLKYNRQ